MRIFGALLVLGHLSVNLVVGGGINAFDFDLVAGRYTNPFWQLWNLTILWLAMLSDHRHHHFLGALVIFTFDPYPSGADLALLPSFYTSETPAGRACFPGWT